MLSDILNTTKELQNSRNNQEQLYYSGGNLLMKPINIQIPDELYDAVKNYAKEQNISMAEVVRAALRRYVYPEGSSKTLTIRDLLEQINELQKRLEQVENHVKNTRKKTDNTYLESNKAKTPAKIITTRQRQEKLKKETPETRAGTGLYSGSPSFEQKIKTSKSTYETLILHVMKQKPSKIWSLSEIYEEIMINHGKELEKKGIILKKDSLKDRIARMVRNGTIKKIGRGQYSLE